MLPDRTYQETASKIAAIVQARTALRSAYDSLSEALGLPTEGNDKPSGKAGDVARLLASAEHDAKRAASTLASVSVPIMPTAETPAIDAMLGGGK